MSNYSTMFISVVAIEPLFVINIPPLSKTIPRPIHYI